MHFILLIIGIIIGFVIGVLIARNIIRKNFIDIREKLDKNENDMFDETSSIWNILSKYSSDINKLNYNINIIEKNQKTLYNSFTREIHKNDTFKNNKKFHKTSIDEILDKINNEGFESLSNNEKDILRDYNKKRK
mgnify:CR=1 FL=1